MEIRRRPYLQSFCGNPIVYAWYDEESKTNPDLLFEIRVYFKSADPLAVWKLLPSAAVTPVNGSAEVDISHILLTELKLVVPDPDEPFTESTTQTATYYVEYRRISLAGTINEAFNTSEHEYIRQVIWGGIQAYMWQGNNFWVNYFAQENKYLTWQLNNRLAAFSETIYLAWFNNSSVSADKIRIHVVAVYTTGEVFEKSVMLPATNNRVYYIAAGADQLDIPIPDGKSLWFWSLTVQDISVLDVPVAISQTFTYYADNRNDYNKVILCYRNSLGGIDSVRIRGDIENNISLEGTDIETAARADWAFSKHLPYFNKSLPHREIVTFKGDTGFLGKEEQDRLRDIFLNREVYELKHGRWWPVKIITKQYKQKSSTDQLWSLQMEWTYGDGGSFHYTPDLFLGKGLNFTNVCSAKVVNILPEYTYTTPNLALVKWPFEIDNQTTDVVNYVEWKLPGFYDQWQTFNYPFNEDFPIATMLPAPGSYTIYLRALCEGGSPGPISTETVEVPVQGSPPPPPHGNVYNSNMENNTDIITPASIIINGQSVFAGVASTIRATRFNTVDGLSNIILNLAFAVPVVATLKTADGFGPHRGDINTAGGGGCVVTWNGINITNGIIIEFS